MAIDAMLHDDRKLPSGQMLPANPAQAAHMIISTIIDNRRALDYAVAREDIDSDRILLIGVSTGGIAGSILAAVEPRIDGAALLVAGGRWDLFFQHSHYELIEQARAAGWLGLISEEQLAPFEPVNFIGYIAPRPLFMANGLQDEMVPSECAQALHEAAGEPKEIHWYDADHIGAVIQAIPHLGVWLSQQLATPSQPEAPQEPE